MEKERRTLRAEGEIKSMMLDIEKKEAEVKEIKKASDSLRKTVKDTMLENSVDCYLADDGNEKLLQALVYQSTKINYDLDAIKEKISKEQRKLVTKIILIADESNLKAFLKAHPELREEVKKFVNKVELVDENKLGLAIEYGDIKLKDIEGCFDVKTTDNFKIQRVKDKELL